MTDLATLLGELKQLARKGKFDEAIRGYSIGIMRARDEFAYKVEAEFLNGRGVMHRMKREYDFARNDYTLAHEVSKLAMDNEQSALPLVNLADLHRVAYGDLASAHSSLDEALDLVTDGSLINAQARDQRGLVFVGEKKFDCAIAAYEGAQGAAEKLLARTPDDEDVQNRFGQILHHIGCTYVQMNDPEKFEAAYISQQKALELFEKFEDGAGIANTVSTMGHLALAAGRYAEVVELGERALKIVLGMNYERGVRTVTLNLTEAHLQLGNMKEVMPYLAILNKDISNLGDNDAGLMDAQFKRVIALYQKHGLPAEDFGGLMKRFS